ncbi:class I SAM-dependent methyltransferase [Alicyclobacillaceae bacterium I2511]|nr:class I SAM-dependent methyltransferase [Alicyclobacillaceae bacterium I2511]
MDHLSRMDAQNHEDNQAMPVGHAHPHGAKHAFNPERLLAMEEGRITFMPPEPILAKFLTSSGMTMADIGCGAGYFTLPAAKLLTHGRVYAIDRQENMVDFTTERANEAGLTNVLGVVAPATDLPLADKSVDAVLMSMVFHDIPEQSGILSEARRVLVPGGTLYLVEWDKTGTRSGPPMEIRLRPEELQGILESAGFVIREITHSDVERAIYFVDAELPAMQA